MREKGHRPPGCEWSLITVIKAEVAAVGRVDLFPPTWFLVDCRRVSHGTSKRCYL